MVAPNLLNPILIEIRQIDESETAYAPRRREPVNRVKRKTSFKIKAQIFFTEQQFLEAADGGDARNLAGDILNTVGWIVVKKSDLKRLNKTLKKGDEIVSYGTPETKCEYFLIGKKEGAHYTDQGTTTLEKWFFEDRN